MQIHELNNFTGTLGSGAYLAVDDGNDTGKLSTQQLLSATEARIDNIIAGPAPSAEEIVDARLGADGVTYPSLGDAIRDQVSDLKDDISVLDDCSIIPLIKDYYIKTNESIGATVNLTPLSSSSGYSYAIVNCVEGDTFIINGTGGSSARLWCFIDSSNKVIDVAVASESMSNGSLVAPKNTAKLVLNCTSAGMQAYKGKAVSVRKTDISLPSKNLLGFVKKATSSDASVTLTTEESSITFTGTASADVGFKLYFGGRLCALDASNGDALTMSYEIESGTYSNSGVYLSLANVSGTSMRLDQKIKITFNLSSAMSYLYVWINNGTAFNNFKINIQIEKGSTATPFCRYGGAIANDKVARANIVKLSSAIDSNTASIDAIESAELVTNRFTEFVVGTLSSGVPSSADYRLRTINYIPFDCFYKATWDGSHIVNVCCYDADYTYLGITSNFTSGVLHHTDITDYQDTAYIKLLFATNPVGTITLEELTTANFKLYSVLAQDNLYDNKNANELPSLWSVPYRTINQMQGDGFTFAIQTDTHYEKEIDPIYYNSLKNLSRRIGFDFIANLGDIIRGYQYDTVSDSYAEYEKAISGLVDGAECSTFCLMGNHDNNSMYAAATSDIDNAFLPSELFALFERPTTTEDEAVVWGSRKGLYFYRDFDNVRVIVLNTSDLPYEALGDSDISVNRLEISDAQIAWFTNTALNTEKQVLVLSHAPLSGSTTVYGREYILSALNTFVNGGGVVIACVAGHTHNIGATTVDGINHIVCDNGSDICEVFAVDLVNKTITTQQIGKNFTSSRSFTY